MDLSDGLAADLPRIARASGTGFRVDEAQIPVAEGCTVAQALGDGEDYELLFALGQKRSTELEQKWKHAFPTLQLTPIGHLTELSRTIGREQSGGYDHFANVSSQAGPDPST